MAAGRGARPWSRLAGLASVAWGLVVWVFGESFGGIFAPGLSWLTGAPGAVLIYVVAGALIALPERAWRGPRLGGCCWAGSGCSSSAWRCCRPGRAAASGRAPPAASRAPLAGMVQSMAGTPQPHVLSALVAGFGSFAASNGFAVNLVVVIALAAMGAVFLSRQAPAGPVRVWFGLACSAWRTGLLVQDLGFLGGLGTDPNSMIPWILLFFAGLPGADPGAGRRRCGRGCRGSRLA